MDEVPELPVCVNSDETSVRPYIPGVCLAPTRRPAKCRAVSSSPLNSASTSRARHRLIARGQWAWRDEYKNMKKGRVAIMGHKLAGAARRKGGGRVEPAVLETVHNPACWIV